MANSCETNGHYCLNCDRTFPDPAAAEQERDAAIERVKRLRQMLTDTIYVLGGQADPVLCSDEFLSLTSADAQAVVKQRDAALAMLRRLEWDWLNCCPICIGPECDPQQALGRRDTGHAPGCELAKLLKGGK